MSLTSLVLALAPSVFLPAARRAKAVEASDTAFDAVVRQARQWKAYARIADDHNQELREEVDRLRREVADVRSAIEQWRTYADTLRRERDEARARPMQILQAQQMAHYAQQQNAMQQQMMAMQDHNPLMQGLQGLGNYAAGELINCVPSRAQVFSRT